MQLVEDAVHLVVVDDADDGVVQGRPGMGAVVRLARIAAVAFDFVPFSEAFRAVVIQHLGDFVVVGLIVCDEYCFHGYLMFSVLVKASSAFLLFLLTALVSSEQ